MYVLITSQRGSLTQVASLQGNHLKLNGKVGRSILGVVMTNEERGAFDAIRDCINCGSVPAPGCVGSPIGEVDARYWYPSMEASSFVGFIYLLDAIVEDCLVLHSVWKK